MLKAQKTLGTSIHEGKVMVRFLGEDQKVYDVLLPQTVATEAVLAILQAAKDLPASPQQTVQGAIVQAHISLAIGDNMQPLLAVALNGLELAFPLTEVQLTSLRDDMTQLLAQGKTAH